jgi:hypothetical protein
MNSITVYITVAVIVFGIAGIALCLICLGFATGILAMYIATHINKS